MEIADVRRRVNDTIARARTHSTDRRERTDTASRSFDRFLNVVAVPLVRQIVNVLRTENYSFNMFTPPESVRLMSERHADDYIEIWLDTSGNTPRVVAHVSRSRGHRGFDAHRVIGSGDPDAITDEQLLSFLLEELEPLLQK
jgi:hypothetical protein